MYEQSVQDMAARVFCRPLNDDDRAIIHEILIDSAERAKFDDVTFHNYSVRPVKKSTIPAWRIANAYMMESKPIASLYGTFFKQHNVSTNRPAAMVSYLMDTRKVEKKAMNAYPEDSLEYAMHDRGQKVYKLMANSFYGVLSQSSFVFFNRLLGPSITYQGVGIITSSMVAMEAFLANNVKFQTFDDIVVFITNVSKDYEQAVANEFNILDYLDEDKVKTANEVLTYLTITQTKFMVSNGQLGMLASMISVMPKQLLQFLYYKRNFMSLVSNTKVLKMMLECVPDGEELFNDPNHPLDSIKQPLDAVYRIIRIIVGYEYAYFRRYDMAMTMERCGVALVKEESLPAYMVTCRQQAS